MNPNFVGLWIPKEVFHHKDLSANAKFIYGIVDGLDNEDGCYASNGYLASVLNLSERQVRTLLGELEKLSLIKRLEVNGSRVIRTVEKVALQEALNQPSGRKLPMGRKKTSAGGGRKLPTYNIEDNIEDINTIPWSEPLPFSSDEFSRVWQSWIDYRKEIKKPLKDSTVKAQFREFTLWGEQKSIQAIQASIKNGWQGLFEPKKSIGIYTTKTLTDKDHNTF